MTNCEVCHRFVGQGDAVELDSPLKFMDRHLGDGEKVIMVWHRKCFEKYFGIELPRFETKKVSE